jgi:FlaA1/EpsC-like NDP-sugar epimerase
MAKKQWLYTKTNQMILDGSVFALALLMAFLIRFDGHLQQSSYTAIIECGPIIVGTRLLIQNLLGIYKHVWKFVSFSDVLDIAQSICIGSFALISVWSVVVVASSNMWMNVPFGVLIVEGFLSLCGSLSIRATRRIFYVRQRKAEAAAGDAELVRVLLYGAGRAGIMLRRELENNKNYEVIGFVDDDSRKVGSTISKTPVLGSGENLEALVNRYKVDQIIISMATASRMTLSRALARCRRANVAAKIIPSLQELISGQVHISQFRDTKVEEVLGRESVEVANFESLAGSTYRGKRLLVTGAGGSIGTEAVRQAIRLKPASIIAVDIDENAIYELEQELLRRKIEIPFHAVICNIADNDRLRAVFETFRPQIVIHAAAHKHVPLMENQPCQAVLNNVGGTRNVLEVSTDFNVERLVFISSDKAVNPVNVMGATKRLGELLVQAFSHRGLTRSACVRFGNVLGSQGSVIPLFKKQIEAGGPVTITHPGMVRYFMTVQEAVQLVLCAGTLASGGDTFVLDMGHPRGILELAREMILLAGLEPDRDIDTVIVGLRPGEKLFEELVAPSEKLRPTKFEKLSLIEPQHYDVDALLRNTSHLIHSARANDLRRVRELLLSMDLGYSAPIEQTRALAAVASQNAGGTFGPGAIATN